MKFFPSKIVALAAALAVGSLLSGSAEAGVLRTAEGIPVLTKNGAPVYTGCYGYFDTGYSMAGILDDNIVLFSFNRSSLTKPAKSQLRALASKLDATKTVTIVGYADRMGNAEYNEKLALRRAKAVRDFLVGSGIKAKTVEVRSLGKSVSRTDCQSHLSRDEMISCLSGDRRVEIEVE